MNSFIKPVALAAMIGTTCATMAADTDVDARLERMEQIIEQQQRELSEMRGAMSGQQYLTHDEAARLIQNEMSAMVDERVEAGMAQMRDSSPILTLGSNIDGLDIRGDLRLRYERTEFDMDSGDDSSLDRFRVRLRLGAVWKSEGWEVGVGFATGSTSGSSATSTNQTYNDGGIFKTNSINLDYAYAKHTWGDLSLTVGQMKNPFEGSWIMWDGDVRPVGAVAHYEYQGFFVTGGILPSMHIGTDEADAFLTAIQFGYEGSYDQLDYLVATSYYHFTDANLSDGVVSNGSSFNIWDLYGELSYDMNDVTIGLHGHVLYNFGADGPDGVSSQVSAVPGDYEPEENDLAWMLGGSVGYKGVKLSYDYAHIEGESAFAAINDGDFGGSIASASSVDVKGHKLGLGYKVNKNLSFQGTAFFVETVEGDANNDSGQLYQLDAIWKF